MSASLRVGRRSERERGAGEERSAERGHRGRRGTNAGATVVATIRQAATGRGRGAYRECASRGAQSARRTNLLDGIKAGASVCVGVIVQANMASATRGETLRRRCPEGATSTSTQRRSRAWSLRCWLDGESPGLVSNVCDDAYVSINTTMGCIQTPTSRRPGTWADALIGRCPSGRGAVRGRK